jgi:hypothetical protein
LRIGVECSKHGRPEGLAALLRADAGLDEVARMPASFSPDAEAGAAVIEPLHILGAFRRLQLTDECISEPGMVVLPSRNEKVAFNPQRSVYWCHNEQMILRRKLQRYQKLLCTLAASCPYLHTPCDLVDR